MKMCPHKFFLRVLRPAERIYERPFRQGPVRVSSEEWIKSKKLPLY
jgi:hypothetical protein